MCIFCSSLQRTTSLVTHLKAIHVYHISTSRHEINRLAIYTKLKKQEITGVGLICASNFPVSQSQREARGPNFTILRRQLF